MDFERHQSDLRSQRKTNRTLAGSVAVLALSQLVSLVVIVGIAGSERTVIVPPNIERSFWVSKDKASREYLEQMAAYVAWLTLDVTPATVDWKRNALLDWAVPSQHAALKTQMDLEAERLRRHNAATSFLPQQLVADENEQTVVVVGRLRRQINGADVGEPETRSYLARFAFAGGRVHLHTFKEIAHAQSRQALAGGADAGAGAR